MKAKYGAVKERVLKLWDAKRTCAENARACGLTNRQAYIYANTHQLEYVKVRGIAKKMGKPVKARKEKSLRRQLAKHSGSISGAATCRQQEIRKLVAVFHNGGKQGAKAAKELKRLGINARPATESDGRNNVFPFVVIKGIRQMPAGSRPTNPNWRRAKEMMNEHAA